MQKWIRAHENYFTAEKYLNYFLKIFEKKSINFLSFYVGKIPKVDVFNGDVWKIAIFLIKKNQNFKKW